MFFLSFGEQSSDLALGCKGVLFGLASEFQLLLKRLRLGCIVRDEKLLKVVHGNRVGNNPYWSSVLPSPEWKH